MNEYIKGIIELISAQGFFMLGAKNSIVYDNKNNLIRFKVKGCKKFNFIVLQYDASKDLYNLKLSKWIGLEEKNTVEHNGIYNDMVRDLITKETGLYLSMGTMGR